MKKHGGAPSYFLRLLLAFLYITKGNRFERSGNGGRMLRSVKVQTGRGAELLDELAGVLPNLYSFNNESDLDFVSTVILLYRYWNDLKARVVNGNTECKTEFIRILNRMATLHGKTNVPVACGVRVVVCHVEASYLNDEEAHLVQCITDIHIDRAASIVKGKCSLTSFDY